MLQTYRYTNSLSFRLQTDLWNDIARITLTRYAQIILLYEIYDALITFKKLVIFKVILLFFFHIGQF